MLTFRGPRIVNVFQSMTNKMQHYTVFISVDCSTRFGWIPHPSSGAQHCIYSIWYLSNRYCYLPLSWKDLLWNSFQFSCSLLAISPTQQVPVLITYSAVKYHLHNRCRSWSTTVPWHITYTTGANPDHLQCRDISPIQQVPVLIDYSAVTYHLHDRCRSWSPTVPWHITYTTGADPDHLQCRDISPTQ